MSETSNKLIPFNSYFLNSVSNNILDKEAENDKNILNTSFTIKLTDNIKENILKMKNPKKKERNKSKIKKALKELKKEKIKEKPKKNIALKNIKFEKKEHILSRNKKDITIIKNRNASVCLDKRRRYKYIDNEENENTKKNINHSLKKAVKSKPYIKKRNINKSNIINISNTSNNNIKSKRNNDLSKKKKKVESGHVHLKTDVNIENSMKKKINLKKSIEKRNNIRKTRNDRNNDLSDNFMSINLYKRSKNTKEDLYSSFIERKNKRNKNDSNKKKVKVNNNNLYSYNTNYDIKQNKNKKNDLENSYIKKKLNTTTNKNDRKNKSIELRKRIKPRMPEISNINKKLDLSLNKYKTIDNIVNTEREKNKRKIKIDKKNTYNGPLEIKNLIISNTIEYIHDNINKSLRKNQIKFWKLNPYKYSCCAKNMDKFYIEIYYISKLNESNDTIKKNEILEDSENENDDENNSNRKYIFYLKLLLSQDINDIPNSKLLEKVINDIQSRIKH